MLSKMDGLQTWKSSATTAPDTNALSGAYCGMEMTRTTDYDKRGQVRGRWAVRDAGTGNPGLKRN